MALVRGRGIDEADVDRKLRESDHVNDIERSGAAELERGAALNRLIADAAARGADIPWWRAEREFKLIRSQFRDNLAWHAALRGSGLSTFSLGRLLREESRTRVD